MRRDLSGSIHSWDLELARSYGWSRRQAVGAVSHYLLQTVFPQPLDEINATLLRTGCWEGELIHVRSDGRRVKVKSRWVLAPSNTEAAPQVLESNEVLTSISPETAFLDTSGPWSMRAMRLIWHYRWWWIAGILSTWAVLEATLRVTYNGSLAPLSY